MQCEECKYVGSVFKNDAVSRVYTKMVCVESELGVYFRSVKKIYSAMRRVYMGWLQLVGSLKL